MQHVIYEPAGRAREYAPLAANLYKGCPHGCLYCYAPGALRRSREDFIKVAPRPDVLKALRKDAEKLPAGAGPVLLCFSCDPYPAIERDIGLTRAALVILISHRIPVRILTKNPALAVERDLGFLTRARARDLVEFGVSLSFSEEASRKKWEPHAPTLSSRCGALEAAHRVGIPTWVSMEPVVYPAQADELIELLGPIVDVWRVGKLNHDKLNESKVDWRKFLADVLRSLEERGARYRIKADLWACADDAIRAEFPRSKGVPEE